MSGPVLGTWRDVTSYSRDTAPEDRKPRTWEFKTENLTVVVSRRIHREGWFLTCHQLMIDQVLDADDADAARAEAMVRVREWLLVAREELPQGDEHASRTGS